VALVRRAKRIQGSVALFSNLKGWLGKEEFMKPVLDASGKTVKEIVYKLI